jgi:hypothetical protein
VASEGETDGRRAQPPRQQPPLQPTFDISNAIRSRLRATEGDETRQGDENCGGGRGICEGLIVMCLYIYRLETPQRGGGWRGGEIKKMSTFVSCV